MATDHSGSAVVLPDGGDTHDLLVVGHGRITRPFKHGYLAASEAVLGAANLDSLLSAASDERRCCSSIPEHILIAPDGYEAELWDGDPFEPDRVAVEVTEEGVAAVTDPRLVSNRRERPEVQELVRAVASRHNCTATVGVTDEAGRDATSLRLEMRELQDIDGHDQGAEQLERWFSTPGYMTARVVSLRPESTSVATLIAAARDVGAALDAIDGSSPRSPGTVAALIRAGFDEVLSGLTESAWFEAKRDSYPLYADRTVSRLAKHRLACDVAAFANGSVAGLLVVGAETESRNGRDHVVNVHALPAQYLDPGRYIDVLNERIYPRIQGLSVIVAERGQGRILLIPDAPRA